MTIWQHIHLASNSNNMFLPRASGLPGHDPLTKFIVPGMDSLFWMQASNSVGVWLATPITCLGGWYCSITCRVSCWIRYLDGFSTPVACPSFSIMKASQQRGSFHVRLSLITLCCNQHVVSSAVGPYI